MEKISNSILSQYYFIILSYYNYFITLDIKSSCHRTSFHIDAIIFVQLHLVGLGMKHTVSLPIAGVLGVITFGATVS